MGRSILLAAGIVVLLLAAGLAYPHFHTPPKHANNPLAFAPAQVTDILYDNNISDEALEPQLTYWVRGECPNCTILQVEAPLHIDNATYLGFFNISSGSLRLVKANESAVREYLGFFEEHGGRVLECNSTATGRVGNSTFKVKGGTCIVPAIVKVEERG